MVVLLFEMLKPGDVSCVVLWRFVVVVVVVVANVVSGRDSIAMEESTLYDRAFRLVGGIVDPLFRSRAAE